MLVTPQANSISAKPARPHALAPWKISSIYGRLRIEARQAIYASLAASARSAAASAY